MSEIEAEITVAQTARLLDISTRRVSELIRAGFIVKTTSGRVVIMQAVQGYRRSLADQRTSRTISAADAHLRTVKTAEIELRMAERSKKLIEAARAEAEAVVDELGGALRADLSAVAANATDDVPTRRRIEDLIDAAFLSASQRASGEARRARAAGLDLDTRAANDAGSLGRRKQAVSRKRGSTRAA